MYITNFTKMSSTCTSEKIPFYAQNIPVEDKLAKYSLICGIQSKQVSDFSNRSVHTKSEDISKNATIPQDENDYANQKYALGDGVFLKQKPSLSRKREAGNILMECVKRRDNLKNIDFTTNVPFSWDPACSCTNSPQSEADVCRFHNEKNAAVKKVCSYDLDPLSPMDSCISPSTVESGLDSASKICSSDQSTEDILCSSSQENYVKNMMDIDNVVELPSDKNSSIILESSSCNSSVSDLSSQSSVSSVAIYEDLNCLHLTDESVLSNTKTLTLSVSKAPVIRSLFRGVSSAIYFATSGEKVDPMPADIRNLMKWKLSTITPVLIREIVTKSGFVLVNGEKTDEWIGTWGKHMKCATFKGIKNFQKVNHFPGSFHLGRKDKLWDNYRRMQSRHGPNAFHFLPDTFILPADMKTLKQSWELEGHSKYWIIKPPASARGTGIKVIHKWSQVPKNRPVVVQRYISDPYLINGTKFDLRIYVLVPSIDPLRIYIFDDGLVRFASEKYSLSNQTFSNRYMHLTNYSINRKSSSYTANEDGNTCQGHKWTLKSFWTYLANSGVDTAKIKESIVDMVIKTVFCAEGPIFRLMKTYAKSTYNCFELFGFDIMLDKNLRPWLLEVNISPSLHTRSLLDSSVKGQLVKDMLNIASYQVPETNKLRVSDSNHADYGILSSVAHKHKALKNRFLTLEEKNKHSDFTLEHSNEKSDILDNLTPDDVRCLIESEDEYNRKGSFIRVFPSETSSKYFPYFEHKRYYNFLLDAWERRFIRNRKRGIALLQSMCERKLHLRMTCKEVVLNQPDTSEINASNRAIVEVKIESS